MTLGYARCSTDENKQDVQRQCDELIEMGADCVYWEYESGCKRNRSELGKLMRAVKEQDCIVTTEVSRISRNLADLCAFIEFVKSKRLKVVVGSLIFDCRVEPNVYIEGLLKMMGVFGEIERNLIVERVKSGLKHARGNGVKLGRPKLTLANIPPIVTDLYSQYLGGALTKTEYAKACGVSRPTLNKYLQMLEVGADA